MTTLRIRACTHNDIDIILDLDHEWDQEAIAHVFIPISREAFIAQLEQFPSYFLVAEYDGAIVGYINGSIHWGGETTIIAEHEPYIEIENLYVKAEFRHKRVGGQLLEQLLDVAAQHHIQRFLVSSTSKEMEKILTFYQGHGFTLWYVQLFK